MSAPASSDRRVAVVTGGSGAIGGAIAARLSSGHQAIVLDRHGDISVDLSDPDAVRAAAERVLGRYGRCDVLVHAAAMVAFGPLDELQLSTWRQVQAVNVAAHQALPRPLTPEDTASVVAMLARDDAAALTGQVLTVDGGLVLR